MKNLFNCLLSFKIRVPDQVEDRLCAGMTGPGKSYLLPVCRHGYTLITVVFIVAILIVLAAVGLGLTLTEVGVTRNQKGGVEALTAAETGANRAIYFLGNGNLVDSTGQNWKDLFEQGVRPDTATWQNVQLPDGQHYSVKITKVEIEGNKRRMELEVTGTSDASQGQSIRTLAIVVEKTVGVSNSNLGDYSKYAVYSARNFSAINSGRFEILNGDMYSDGDILFDNVLRVSSNGRKGYHYGTGIARGSLRDIEIDLQQTTNQLNLSGPDVLAPNSYRSYVEQRATIEEPVKVASSVIPCVTYSGSSISSYMSSNGNHSLPRPPVSSCPDSQYIRIDNLPGSTLVIRGNTNSSNGNLYIYGNLELDKINNLSVNGDLFVSGSLLVRDSRLSVRGNLMVGGDFMTDGNRGSSIETGSDDDRKGVYVGGIMRINGSVGIGNTEVMGTDEGGKAAVYLAGGAGSSFGDLYVPNGSVLIEDKDGLSYRHVKVKGSFTIRRLNNPGSGGVIFAEAGDVSITDINNPNVDMDIYAGNKVILGDGNNMDYHGVIVGKQGVEIYGANHFSLTPPMGARISGIFSHGNLSIRDARSDIRGLIWVGGNVNFSDEVTVRGGVLSGRDISIRPNHSYVSNVSVTYDKVIIESYLRGFDTVTNSSSVKVLDWKEKL